MRNYNNSQVCSQIFGIWNWWALLFVLLLTDVASAQIPLVEFAVPDRDLIVLDAANTISPEPISECSGMIQSRHKPGHLWVHNDSGDQPRIFLIDTTGQLARSYLAINDGVAINGATNIDWEDISYLGKNLVIGDFGNNKNVRKDLALYLFPEPENAVESLSACKYYFRYPDQDFGPNEKKNYDCEAMFSVDSQLYLITKHRSDPHCTLYRFGQLSCDSIHVPIPYQRANLLNMVTAADYDQASGSLAVLTYSAIWLFQNHSNDLFFDGDAKWLPISARQCEALCFIDANTLLIGNEQRDLFEISVGDLIPVSKR